MGNKICMRKTITIDENKNIVGRVELFRFRTDLMLKYTDIQVNRTVEQEQALFESGLRLVILLGGRSEIRFDSGYFELDAKTKPKAAFLPLNRSEMGKKVFQKGQHQKELVIFLYPKWIMESYLTLSSYHQFKQHLKPYSITVTQPMLRLIDEILLPENESEPFYMIEKESKLLSLLSNAFSQLTQSLPLKKDRVYQLTEALDNGRFDNWNLKQIAKYFHTNVTTLQNEFQKYHKITIFAYLRRAKLEQSYNALLNGRSVMQAAELAGYSNAENFSTAFKKHFAITPSQVKRDKIKGIM